MTKFVTILAIIASPPLQGLLILLWLKYGDFDTAYAKIYNLVDEALNDD